MARSSIRQHLRGLRQAKNKVNLLPEERMVAMKNPKEVEQYIIFGGKRGKSHRKFSEFVKA